MHGLLYGMAIPKQPTMQCADPFATRNTNFVCVMIRLVTVVDTVAHNYVQHGVCS